MRVVIVQKFIDKIRRKEKRNHDVYIRGEQNVVRLPKSFNNKICVQIFGNNNEVVFDENVELFTGDIYIGTPDCHIENCRVIIEGGVTSNGCIIRLLEDNSRVKIGHGSMLSSGIYIAASDTHSVCDSEGRLLNMGSFVDIGENVWISMDVKIGKNVIIPNGCVIGMGSIVVKSFNEENCLLAGNPASIKKREIKWNRLRPKQYMVEKINRAIENNCI